MALKFSKNSTDYLRPDLEYNQLRSNNLADLIANSPDYSVSTTTRPTAVRTTGNGLFYISGSIKVDAVAGGSQGDTIATFPLGFAPTIGSRQFIVTCNSGGTFTQLPITIDKDGIQGLVVIQAGVSQNDQIFLEGIIYFQDA